MIRKHGPAIVLLGAACAPLGTACGVSEGGLGSVAVDAADHFQDDGPYSVDGSPADDSAAQGDAPQDDAGGDAAVGEGGPGQPGADGSPVGEAGSGGPDAVGVSDAGADGPPRGEAGPDTGSGLDAGGLADASGDGATTTCDFSGTWGSRLVINVSWTPQGITGIILSPGSGTITQWLLSTRTLSGTTANDSAVVCGIALPDFDGTAIAGGEVYGIRFPNSLFDNDYVPAFAVHGTLSGSSPGSTYNTTAAAVLLGLTLSNAATAPWPATITTQVDMDKDGKPGVTANSLQGSGYTYPPVDLFKTNRADELYLAIRQVTQLSATASDCDHMSGTVSIPTITDASAGTSKPAIDSHVIGCRISGTTTDCNSTQATFVDNTQPVFTPSGGSGFTSQRMASGSTCAAVRLALQ